MAEIETLWDIDLRETGKREFKPFRKNSKLLTSRAKKTVKQSFPAKCGIDKAQYKRYGTRRA